MNSFSASQGAQLRLTYLIWECDKHELMARPDVEIVGFHLERWFAVCGNTGGHPEFNILVRNVLLIEVHPEIIYQQVISVCSGESVPHKAHHLPPHIRVTAVCSNTKVERDGK